MKKAMILFAVAVTALCASARPGPGGPGGHFGGGPAPRHHHRGGAAWGIGAGILGAGLVASSIYAATHPQPVVVASPAPVVVSPAPVVVSQPTVVTTGHYETRTQNVWVEGRYVDQYVNGVLQRVWQPGHYEQVQTQVWVQ